MSRNRIPIAAELFAASHTRFPNPTRSTPPAVLIPRTDRRCSGAGVSRQRGRRRVGSRRRRKRVHRSRRSREGPPGRATPDEVLELIATDIADGDAQESHARTHAAERTKPIRSGVTGFLVTHRTSYSDVFRSRSAFPIIDPELRLIAAAAIIGLSKSPIAGLRTPAARRTR